MKLPDTQKKLSFIPNKAGLPNYDKAGKTIRVGLRKWHSCLEAGLCPEPLTEKLSGNCRSIQNKLKTSQTKGNVH